MTFSEQALETLELIDTCPECGHLWKDHFKHRSNVYSCWDSPTCVCAVKREKAKGAEHR